LVGVEQVCDRAGVGVDLVGLASNRFVAAVR